MSFSARGLAGGGPEPAAADAAVLLHQEGEGVELFDVFWMGGCRGLGRGPASSEGAERGSGEARNCFQGVSMPKSTRRWPFCSSSGDIKARAEAEDADDVGTQAPGLGRGPRGERRRDRVRRRPRRRLEARAKAAVCRLLVESECPELPAHLELVCHVVVELLRALRRRRPYFTFVLELLMQVRRVAGGGFFRLDALVGGQLR